MVQMLTLKSSHILIHILINNTRNVSFLSQPCFFIQVKHATKSNILTATVETGRRIEKDRKKKEDMEMEK